MICTGKQTSRQRIPNNSAQIRTNRTSSFRLMPPILPPKNPRHLNVPDIFQKITTDAMHCKKLRPAASSHALCGAHLSYKLRSSRLAFLALLAFYFACSAQSASMVWMKLQINMIINNRYSLDTCFFVEPSIRIELMTSSLPWMRSAY
jgi:hypothetical protein